MTDSNEDSIKAFYANISEGRGDLIGDFLADDVIWQIPGTSPVSGRYVGKQAVLGFFAKIVEVYGGTFKIEVVDVLADDKYGVVIGVESGAAGGKELESDSVHVWTIRDGKCASFQCYEGDSYHQFWSLQLQTAVSRDS
jgi:ketosteroid isomerase-like protein